MPGSLQKTVHAFDSVISPFGIQFRRPHEELIHAQRVAAEVADKIIRVDNIPLRLRHLFGLPAFADIGDHPLVKQALERLIKVDDPRIVQKHREEPRIKQM